MHPQFESHLCEEGSACLGGCQVHSRVGRNLPSTGWDDGSVACRFRLLRCRGGCTSSGAYITCGFLFATQLDKVVRYTSVFANVLILALGVPLLILFVWKLIQLARMVRLILPSQITPEELKARLDSGEAIGILDLLRFEDDPRGVSVIPGAVRLDPLKIRRKRRISMPDGLDLVIYCESKNSFVSARVAAAMRKHGIVRIRVLAGGLAAWKALQFPLSLESRDPEVEMTRLGIEMFPPWTES